MSAEAIARLRATATMHSDFLHIPVSVDDLRALLDAHTEALDALEGVHKAEQRFDKDGNGAALGVAWGCVLAVLAKAGRR